MRETNSSLHSNAITAERFRALSPGSAEVGELGREVERRWQAYEWTVNEADTSWGTAFDS